MVLLPRIACEPPLGEITVVDSAIAEFVVALDWSSQQQQISAASCEVVVWHNGGADGQWHELSLHRLAPALLHVSQQSQQYFTGSLERGDSPNPVQFTLKFRSSDPSSGQSDWQWANAIDPRNNGQLLFQVEACASVKLSDLFHHLDQSWNIDPIVPASSEELRLWSLRNNVNAARGTDSGWTHTRLGLPKQFSRWFALVRHSTPWLGPRQGDGLFSPDKDAILASFLRDDGLHVLVLGLNGISDVSTTLKGNKHGHIVVSSRNDSPEDAHSVVLIAVSTSFDTAMKAIMDHAKSVVSECRPSTVMSDQQLPTLDEASDVALEDWRDGFSYCTWNGVGQNLNEEKILGALDSLTQNKIDISNLIIDDNWQSIDYKGDSNFNFRWTEFDANKENFPKGLRHTISRIRKEHGYIKHIAVWHGIFGYWNGISPTGAIAKEYKTKEVKKQSHEGYMGGGTTVTVAADDVRRMYDDFYSFLSSTGVDGVKADVQFYPDYLYDAPDRRAMMYAYQDAWTNATEKHFQGRAISCMSMTPQILFHSLLLEDKPRYMARNSDDFFPFDPSSHTWHIFMNSHNTLLTQHLNILPDWDMFQTVHEYAGLHAAARCLSGGPIYITDTPGQHNVDLINQMTAKSIAGRTIILRPDEIGTTMEIYVQPHSNRFLRIGTTSFSDSLLGLFNIGDRTRIELVKLSSFRKINKKEKYSHKNDRHVIRKHSNGHVFGPFDLWEERSVVPVQLDPKGYEILTAYRCSTMAGVTFSFLGLLGKMSGACVKTSYRYSMQDEGHGLKLEVGIKAVGVVGLYLLDASKFLDQKCIRAGLRIGSDTQAVKPRMGEEKNVVEFDLENVVGVGSGSAKEASLFIDIGLLSGRG